MVHWESIGEQTYLGNFEFNILLNGGRIVKGHRKKLSQGSWWRLHQDIRIVQSQEMRKSQEMKTRPDTCVLSIAIFSIVSEHSSPR